MMYDFISHVMLISQFMQLLLSSKLQSGRGVLPQRQMQNKCNATHTSMKLTLEGICQQPLISVGHVRHSPIQPFSTCHQNVVSGRPMTFSVPWQQLPEHLPSSCPPHHCHVGLVCLMPVRLSHLTAAAAGAAVHAAACLRYRATRTRG